jgi:hypothetical protein
MSDYDNAPTDPTHGGKTWKSSRQVLMFDPPSGWKYGFPVAFPLDATWKDIEAYLEKSGYPMDQLDLAKKHSRYWVKTIEDED